MQSTKGTHSQVYAVVMHGLYLPFLKELAVTHFLPNSVREGAKDRFVYHSNQLCVWCTDWSNPFAPSECGSPIRLPRTGSTKYCTREEGHEGFHVACSTVLGHALYVWHDDDNDNPNSNDKEEQHDAE